MLSNHESIKFGTSCLTKCLRKESVESEFFRQNEHADEIYFLTSCMINGSSARVLICGISGHCHVTGIELS